jgi:heptosyltransferase-2
LAKIAQSNVHIVEKLTKNNFKEVLIISPNWVGDSVMAEPLFSFLKIKYASHITVLCPKFLFEIFDHMNSVDSILTHNFRSGKLELKKRFAYGKKIENHYTTCILLTNSLKSAIIPFVAKIPVRIGYDNEVRRFLLTNPKKKGNKASSHILSYLNLIRESSTNVNNRPKFKFNKIHQRNDSEKSVIASICPGGDYGKAKRWPEKNFNRLIKKLIKYVDKIQILGSKKDIQNTNKIVKDLETEKKIENHVGKTSISDVIKLIAESDFIITNDTGLMHIATALNIQTISIFGSTSPSANPPLADNSIILKKKMNCSPCFKSTCDYGHYNCIKSISVDDILNQLNKVSCLKINL